jgi:hypothetical protein
MKSALFLLLRLICYPALALALAAGFAFAVVSVNGQCPPMTKIGVSCATRFSQGLADFSLAVGVPMIFGGVPLVFVVGGLIFAVYDAMRLRARRRLGANRAPS